MPGAQGSGSDSYISVTGIRTYDGRHQSPNASIHSSPGVSLPATPPPRRGTVDSVNFYDLESGEAFSANQDKKGNWFVRQWNQATQGWDNSKSRTTLAFVKAVGPELVAAAGKVVVAAGYEKTGKVITATGALARAGLDGGDAVRSKNVSKVLTSSAALLGAGAQYPLPSAAQNGMEAVAVFTTVAGRAADSWQPAPAQPFSTDFPLNTQIASYATASPNSMSPVPETPIGPSSSGSEADPEPLLRRRTTHQQFPAVQGMTSMLPPERREDSRRPRQGVPPLARTTSSQVPPRGNGPSR